MNYAPKKLSLIVTSISSIFLATIHFAPSLANEAQALECLMENEPQMQFIVCQTYGDRLADKKEFTGEYSFLMMNVVVNQIRQLSKEKDKSKELLKATLLSMFDIIKKNDANFIQTSFDYATRLGPAAQKKYDTEMQFLTAVMKGN